MMSKRKSAIPSRLSGYYSRRKFLSEVTALSHRGRFEVSQAGRTTIAKLHINSQPRDLTNMASGTQMVQCFGKKKTGTVQHVMDMATRTQLTCLTATAVAHCKVNCTQLPHYIAIAILEADLMVQQSKERALLSL